MLQTAVTAAAAVIVPAILRIFYPISETISAVLLPTAAAAAVPIAAIPVVVLPAVNRLLSFDIGALLFAKPQYY